MLLSIKVPDALGGDLVTALRSALSAVAVELCAAVTEAPRVAAQLDRRRTARRRRRRSRSAARQTARRLARRRRLGYSGHGRS